MRTFRFTISILFFLTTLNSVVGQPDTVNINKRINQLSWESISMNCIATMLVLTHEDSTEKALVKIGKPATNKLIAALDDTSKTVIAHIILTEIWGDKKSKTYFSEWPIYKDCNQLIGSHYIYNGLVWEWYSGGNNIIRKSEVDKIKQYWTAKLIEKKNVSIDLAKITLELEKQDNLLYPCNKIYENNAADMKFQNLYILLNKKSDDTLFKKLWDKFGNDSTVSVYDDCFFIDYGPEGLSFRFEKDSTLSTIFVEDSYRGELPYNLKLTDLKPVVENKIGKPFKSGKYVDNTWGWYKDKSLYLDFDKKGRIIKFGISKT